MGSSNGYLKITESDLKEIMKMNSEKIVGRVLKRMEIHDNMKAMKSEIKELLYEQLRDLHDAIYASGKGLISRTFTFNKQGEIPSTDKK